MANRTPTPTEQRSSANTEYGYGYFVDMYASSRAHCSANLQRDASGRCTPCQHYACSRQCDGGASGSP
ncbi:hypothetical protein OL229_10320 [Neisseriaceae bacterium JH1-16]|nr:hypothetical protein [Neisseriaceae bacterium JH1-16]